MIIKGTTPTLRWTFDVVDPATITTAYLTFKQGCGPDVEKWETVLEKDISGMTRGESYVDWDLTQEDTMVLRTRQPVDIQMNYKTSAGKRYATAHVRETIGINNKDGEI